MTWTVAVAKPARKQLARFPANDQVRIEASLKAAARYKTMTLLRTITRRISSLYVAYAPESGLFSYGCCFAEAVNGLADKIQAQQAGIGMETGHERNGHAEN